MRTLWLEQAAKIEQVRVGMEGLLQEEHEAAVRNRLWGLAAAIAKAQATVRRADGQAREFSDAQGSYDASTSPDQRWSRLPSPTREDDSNGPSRPPSRPHSPKATTVSRPPAVASVDGIDDLDALEEALGLAATK